MLNIVPDAHCGEVSPLDEIVREGAQRMLAAALQAEADAYVEALTGEVDADGYRLVVRNGHHRRREVVTGAGAVAVKAPRVNDKRVDPDTGQRQRFASNILLAWVRKSPKVETVLPLLHVRGLSTGDFKAAVEQFLGTGAGLSPGVITKLTKQCQDQAQAFNERSLAGTDFGYVWVWGYPRERSWGRCALQGPPGPGQGVPTGHDRCAC